MIPTATPLPARCADTDGSILPSTAHVRPVSSLQRHVQNVRNAATESDASAALGRLMLLVRAHLGEVEAAIQHAEARGDRARVKELRWWVSRSFALRLHGAYLAARKLNGLKRPGGSRRQRITAREVIEMAERLDLRADPRDPVRVRAIPKRGVDAAMPHSLTESSRDPDAYRYVCNFGFEDRARQYALLWLASVGPARQRVEGQYVGAENGFIRMQADFIAGLEAGFVHVWTGDIRNCFRHVDTTNLHKEFGVSARVLTNNALVSPDRVIFAGVKGGATDKQRNNRPINLADAQAEDIIEEHAIRLAHRGVPQGSAAAPRLAQIALAALPGMLPAGTRFFQWVDDISIQAMTPAEAAESKDALLAALNSGALHGHFEVKRPDLDVVDARRGLEFWGLYFYRHEGRFHARPATSRLRDCEAKIKACATLGVVHPWWLAKAERILDGFLRNYPFWHVAHLFRARMMQHIEMVHLLRRLTGQAPAPRGARPSGRGDGPQGRRRVGWIPEKPFRVLRVITGLIEPRCKRGACDDPDEGRSRLRPRPLPMLAA